MPFLVRNVDKSKLFEKSYTFTFIYLHFLNAYTTRFIFNIAFLQIRNEEHVKFAQGAKARLQGANVTKSMALTDIGNGQQAQ